MSDLSHTIEFHGTIESFNKIMKLCFAPYPEIESCFLDSTFTRVNYFTGVFHIYQTGMTYKKGDFIQYEVKQ